MATSKSGITDSIEVRLNPSDEAEVLNPDVKGPDPAQWDDPGARVEDTFDPGEGAIKGPDPVQWPGPDG